MTTTRWRVVVMGGVGAATAFALLLGELGLASAIAAAFDDEGSRPWWVRRSIGRLTALWGRLTASWDFQWTPAGLVGSIAHRQAA